MHTIESELVTKLYEVATDAQAAVLDDLLVAAGLVIECVCGVRGEVGQRCDNCGVRAEVK
jgi:hypothetical protein